LHDKLLPILSENSICSGWVEDEVTKAFAEERDRKQPVLFPVCIDDAVMETQEPWARKLRDQLRHRTLIPFAALRSSSLRRSVTHCEFQ